MKYAPPIGTQVFHNRFGIGSVTEHLDHIGMVRIQYKKFANPCCEFDGAFASGRSRQVFTAAEKKAEYEEFRRSLQRKSTYSANASF